MTRFSIDFPSADLDGSKTLSSSGESIGSYVLNAAKDEDATVSDDNLAGGTTAFASTGPATVNDVDAIYQSIGVRSVVFDSSDPDAGVVTFFDGTTMPVSQIENVIPCFTPGTTIATPKGGVLVEKLKVGDRVITRDNGIKTISWVGNKRLDYMQLKKFPELRPIKIGAGSLGPNVPDRDMMVSPMHRMLIVSEIAQLYFNQSEVLIPAKYLLAIDGVEMAETAYATYIHFMCDTHEIVLSDGAWSESFQPGDYSLKGLDEEQRAELFSLFPDLTTKEGVKAYRAARPSLKMHEAALLFNAS